ncbi:hypothetical protein CEK29_00530 [Bordetella genomosp. 5]|nr:hypothetical protein CEK29_00530 [Bordetella genomosp. 5]
MTMQINSNNLNSLSRLDAPAQASPAAPAQTESLAPVPASAERYAQVSLQSLSVSSASPRGLTLIKDLENGIPANVQIFIKPTKGSNELSLAWQIAAPPPGGVEHVVTGIAIGKR